MSTTPVGSFRSFGEQAQAYVGTARKTSPHQPHVIAFATISDSDPVARVVGAITRPSRTFGRSRIFLPYQWRRIPAVH